MPVDVQNRNRLSRCFREHKYRIFYRMLRIVFLVLSLQSEDIYTSQTIRDGLACVPCAAQLVWMSPLRCDMTKGVLRQGFVREKVTKRLIKATNFTNFHE